MSRAGFAGLGTAVVVTGSVAGLLSSVGLAVAAEAEGVAPLRPINATSHWLNGDFAGFYGGADRRRTGVGLATNAAACLFWALPFTAWQRLHPAETAGTLVRDGLVMAPRRSGSRRVGKRCCRRPAWRAPTRPWRSASRPGPRSTGAGCGADFRHRGSWPPCGGGAASIRRNRPYGR